MKSCPNCQTHYTDDTLQFCLQDGTPLVSQSEETSAPTVVLDETATVITPRSPVHIPIKPETQSTTDYTTKEDYIQPEKKSNIFKIVALTVLTMFLLLTAIGAGAWFYFNSGEKEIAKNTNTVKNTKTATKQTPETNKSENIETNTDDITETPTPPPTATPEQTPEINVGQVKKEVTQTLNSWTSAAEALNENQYMSFYADRLDYYNRKGVSIDFVRKDKVRALSPYDDVKFNISNLSVTTNDTGDIATAVFDKQWVFEGEEKYSEGKVQSQVKFKQFGGKWKIISEKDLKVYYVNN